jgi:hypothetical protein
MAATLPNEVMQDELALSIARVLAAANKRAGESGVDVAQSIITITQRFEDDIIWRVNYGKKNYLRQRGGDFIVDVNANDASIKQVLFGQ